MTAPVRVLIVDDSAVIRTVITRTLTTEPDMAVVGTAPNGEAGVKSIQRLDPDIVVLDIEMPVMDGLTALPLILKEKPGVKVLICSTLSARGADISVRALELGAAECLLKPGSSAIVTADSFRAELLRVIRALAGRRAGAAQKATGKFTLRPAVAAPPPRIVAIGSSTGGPKALMDVMPGLKGLNVPIIVTQHMPATFTAMLAQHIAERSGIPSHEATEGMTVRPGCVYVAPGGRHMTLKRGAGDPVIALTDEPPENFCRPSVNPMLRSLIPIYGNRIMTVMLTGMGIDGSQAAADVVAAGGRVIAQDEATSVVWGMPGAVAMAGLCSAVLPAEKISDAVKAALAGRPL